MVNGSRFIEDLTARLNVEDAKASVNKVSAVLLVYTDTRPNLSDAFLTVENPARQCHQFTR